MVSGGGISLVYLARGGLGGLDAARAFLGSYMSIEPGIEHSLTVITKNWNVPADLNALHHLLAPVDCRIVPLPDDGFDLGAYLRIGVLLDGNWVCFVNTHSVILAPHWLRILYSAASSEAVGAVGATGSWESHFDSLLRSPLPRDVPRKINRLATLAINYVSYPKFPNPHLRTNAFFMHKRIFDDLTAVIRIPRSKANAYRIESGIQGITQRIKRMGLDVLVCGADGVEYPSDRWPESGTFHSHGQINLLVSDNQTRRYQSGDTVTRLQLMQSTWGLIPDKD